MTEETVTSEVTHGNRKEWLVPFRFKEGNPGRPRGSRNRLTDAFIAALEDDFKAHGETAICRVREERPQDYLKVIAMLMPKDVTIKVSDYDEMSDEQLREQLLRITRAIGPLVDVTPSGGDRDDAREATEEPVVVHDLPR